MSNPVEISVVLPCLNEEKTIGLCIDKAKAALEKMDAPWEIVVSDNGSTDRSIEISRQKGARVIHQEKRGYGNAYLKGLEEARGRYMVMADSDNTYDLGDVARFVAPLRNGSDMVMGNRLKGKIQEGAMPWKNRYIGNPLLSGFLRLLFRTPVSDAHCGMRSLTKEAFLRMNLRTPGMEFASEMVIHAVKAKLSIAEIPITLYANKGRVPHLRPFTDGWRHLRFMLLYSPDVLFLVPGLILTSLGLTTMGLITLKHPDLGAFTLGPNTMMMGSFFTILGVQAIMFNLLVKVHYARHNPLFEIGKATKRISDFLSVERGAIVGLALVLAGVLAYGLVVQSWAGKEFGELSFRETKVSLWALTLLILGMQTIFTSLALGILRGGEES